MGAKLQRRVSRSSSRARTALALVMVAAIFARLRTIPSSAMRRSMSGVVKVATWSGLKSWKAFRKLSRLRRMVIQERPDWKASRLMRSKRASRPWRGTPHSSSW
ncbi:hypothetical protein BJP25_03785 [Actinokineospora bangkokensis]|uniref:Uncharacterized protein n=1 Tax=Actinokineospora bangkokensis TaxID=1193682 RepID=A0A1Q9LDL3_9PSEU|nr:hypothetical protein BJP25_03785 [Actinokineospora bangkokensis]